MLKIGIILVISLSVAGFRVNRGINKTDVDFDFQRMSFGLYKQYLNVNKKNYNNPNEYDYRFNIFNDNLKKLTKCNCGKDLKKRIKFTKEGDDDVILVKDDDSDSDFEMNLNNFADLTDEEFNKYYLLPPNFMDTRVYKPISVMEEDYEGEAKMIEINDDYDPIDEALRLEQRIGFSKYDDSHFIKNLAIFHKKKELEEKIMTDIKMNLDLSRKKAKIYVNMDVPKKRPYRGYRSAKKPRTTKYYSFLDHNRFMERKLQQTSFNSIDYPKKYKAMKFSSMHQLGSLKVPKSLDWNKISGVGRVKDQYKCNACYAFAGTAVVEAHARLINNKSISISEQEILDCSRKNNKCVGGQPYLVIDYIIKSGILTSRQYRYTGRPSSCQANRIRKESKFNSVKGYIFARTGVENLIKALQYGPVAVLMHASNSLKYYRSGVFMGNDCGSYSRVNHAALVYGYNLSGSRPYFMLKNGWGSGWGSRGHYKVGMGNMGSRSNKGLCSMAGTRYNVLPVMKTQ